MNHHSSQHEIKHEIKYKSPVGAFSMAQDGHDPDDSKLWMPAHVAPLDIPLEVRMRDEHGPYKLKSKVVRKINPETGKAGWWNADRETWLVMPVHQWRFHPTYVRPRQKPKLLPKDDPHRG